MAEEILVVEVKLWGSTIGAVAAHPHRPGYYEFQYTPEFVKTGLDVAPISMPLNARKRYSFTSLDRGTYYGLPGLLSDALPDKFGNALIDEYLSRLGISKSSVSTLQRLAYIGRRAMGAMEFAPAIVDPQRTEVAIPLQMAHLVEGARKALRGEFPSIAQDIIDVGSSAGGARAKALIGWNPKTNEVVSGQFDLDVGFEHWLLKFDGVGDNGALGMTTGFGRIEYAHYLMAAKAGIKMHPCRLMEENGRAHFMTKRFDRQGNTKLHMQSLCAIAHLDFNLPYVHSYEQWLRTMLEMNLGADTIEQSWLRCVFNVMARNCDDHTKNVAFLMAPGGRWELAPAYDLCFAHNPNPEKWTHQHQMLVAGKARGISKEDLLALGSKFGVKRTHEKFKEMQEVLRAWPDFAKDAGVPETEWLRIAGLQELVSA